MVNIIVTLKYGLEVTHCHWNWWHSKALVRLPIRLLQSLLCYLSSFPSIHHNSTLITHLQNNLQQISSWITANLLTLNSSKTEFLLIGLKQQPSKIHDSSLTTTHSARNLGVIFDEHLTFSDQISACYYHIRELRCIRPCLDFKTATTIATSIVHSKLDYCNSLYHNLPNHQLNRLQQIQNSLARAVVKAPKSSHITPILKSLHWLKVNERIEYKLLFLTYKVLTTSQPSYINNLISVQPPRSNRSSSVVTLSRPSTISSLKITDRSFRYASPRLWNQLLDSFRQPRQSRLDSPSHSLVSSSLLSSPLSSSIIHHFFTFLLHAQNLSFQQILPTLDFFYLPDCLHDNGTGPGLSCSSFYFCFTF